MPLNREQLKRQIKNGLIQNYIDLDNQLTPNGFDLTVKEIHKFKDSGKVDFSNSERDIPETKKIKPIKKNKDDDYGWWNLDKGCYKIKTNEIVDIPKNLSGFAYPRSTLLRMGATIENGVWDGGFKGQSSFLLIVQNEQGIEIKENARVNHIVFEHMSETREGYKGRYNEE